MSQRPLSRRAVLQGGTAGAFALALGGLSATSVAAGTTAPRLVETTPTPIDDGLEPGADFPIAVIRPISGSVVQTFEPFYAGLRIAVDAINADGGILGHKVVIKEYDDQNTPAQGTVAAQRIVSDNVKYVFGPTGSSITLATLAALTPAKVISFPYANDAAVGVASEYPYAFQISYTAAMQGELEVRHFAAAGATKIGFLIEQAAYGQGAVAGAEAALTDLGLATAARAEFAPGAPDMATPLSTLKDAGCDAVAILVGAPADIVRAVTAMVDLEYFPLVGTLPGVWAGPSLDLLKTAIGDKIVCPTFAGLTYDAGSEVGAEVQALADKILADEAGKRSPVPAITAPFFDGLTILRTVAEEIGTFDTEAVAKALETTHSGVLGDLVFTSDSHTGITVEQMAVGRAVTLLDAAASSSGIFMERVA